MVKNMLNLIILIVILVGITLYIGEFTISFKDGFSIKMPNWFEAVSFFILLVGFSGYSASKYINGHTEGKIEAYEEFKETLDQALKDLNNEKEKEDEARNI